MLCVDGTLCFRSDPQLTPVLSEVFSAKAEDFCCLDTGVLEVERERV